MRAQATSATSRAARVAAMLEDLRGAGLKMTPQRSAIVQLFAVDESHPTAQALYERLLPSFPSMSFATVYNTLDALAKAGLSSTLRLGQAARFDPNTAPHHHTVCDVCSEVRDVPALPAEESGDLRAPGAFAVRTVERIYRGTCSACSTSRSARAKRARAHQGSPG